ncbi:hypothetical protein [Salinicola halophilus]|uniref:hypothetical protein n=1 Tax=Salinicola halophilus TaxID=184065 RepID=UPI000DA21276|nr:hypothetical protein [Salinicola halophilus]
MDIVELIDGEDFRQRLESLGVHVPPEAGPETCARLAANRHRANGVDGLDAAVREWLQKTDILLPSVRLAIERHLLPALEAKA